MVLWLDLSNESEQDRPPDHHHHHYHPHALKPQSDLSSLNGWKQECIPLVRERERGREEYHEQGGYTLHGHDHRATSSNRRLNHRGDQKERHAEDSHDTGNGDGNGDGNGSGSDDSTTIIKNDQNTMTTSMTKTTRYPNMNTFSTALGCYPIVREIASQLDLNTLHDLSRTCRQIRANLLQYRRQLVRCSLRCANDVSGSVGRLDDGETSLGQQATEQQESAEERPRQRQGWQQARLDGRTREYALQGGVSICARDMVKECRRCGKVVCRNCTIKPQGKDSFNNRHRRLCPVCQNVPLEVQTEPLYLIASSSKSKSVADGSPDARSSAEAAAAALNSIVFGSGTSSQDSKFQHGHDDISDRNHNRQEQEQEHQPHQHSNRSFTYDAFRRHPCSCADSVWLCNDCGRTLNSATLAYSRGWLWRKKYSDYLGGQLSGIGEGSEGVHCGREMYCLDAKEVEHVIEWNDRSESGGGEGSGDDRGQMGNTMINGNGIINDGHSSIMNGPAVAGGVVSGESNVTTSDYIEVGGGGSSSSISSTTPNIINNTIDTIDHSHSNNNNNHHHHHRIDTHHINIDPRVGGASTRPRPRHEPSYHAREVEGIGGVVRRTMSHRERIGAIVPEYEGERATGRYLQAEREGAVRSWCWWCFRVVPGKEEEERDHD